MILLPAIDILGGKAVRLSQGSFESQTVYDADPLQAARRWVAAGARALHLVDLDGARSGEPVNGEIIARITQEVSVPVQVGGGLRTVGAVRSAISTGAARVVLGTGALRDAELLDHALGLLGERLVVSLDARLGRLATTGWTEEEAEATLTGTLEWLGVKGVRSFVYSSIERDGMLTGPDVEAVRAVAEAVKGSFLYSGGIASLEDLGTLAALREPKLEGVIVGKALYERRFTVAQAQARLEESCTTSG